MVLKREQEKKDATDTLAQHVVAVQFKHLPSRVVEIIKDDIIDTLGVALAGSNCKSVLQLLDLVSDWGGKRESTILVYGDKVPTINAAFMNCTMAHCHDFDDAYDLGLSHTGANTVPVAFVISEHLGGVSGKDLISAIAVGQDLALRMWSYTPPIFGFHASQMYGYFAATATSAKLLGLSKEQIVSAFGIAYSQIAGTFQTIRDGAMNKGLHAGLSGRGGITSALLAQKGFVGTRNNFEGEMGLCKLYCQGKCDLEGLTAELGKRFQSMYLGFKPWPSGRCTHCSLEAALYIANKYDIVADNIEEVEIAVDTKGHQVNFTPPEKKFNPKTPYDAQFSTPYVAACALINRKVDLSCFTEDAVRRHDIKRLLKKEKGVIEPEFDKAGVRSEKIGKAFTMSPSRVTVKMKDGKTYTHTVDMALGQVEKPMSREQFLSKFYYCADQAAHKLPKANLEKAIEIISKLEEVSDVNTVLPLLTSS